jgi:hypothetical protein|tara:strand:+ start:146 stop:325 length:180 start_codon:yes stop_codon:yes gene_type:complete
MQIKEIYYEVHVNRGKWDAKKSLSHDKKLAQRMAADAQDSGYETTIILVKTFEEKVEID